MQAVSVTQFGGPEVLQVAELPVPTPGPGEVVIRVRAAGVNPVETYIRAGTYAKLPSLPFTPGNDAAGEVHALGDGVEGLKLGQRVFTSQAVGGTYAQFALAKRDRVHPLPDALSFEQGATLGGATLTAWRTLFLRAKVRPGQWVLVHGASGGVGLAACQLARAHGCVVVGTAGSAEGEALLRGADGQTSGCHHVVSHADPAHYQQVMALTPGGTRGVDVVVEMLANANLAQDLGMLAQGGTVAVVGSRGVCPEGINPRDLMSREASVVGVMVAKTSPAEVQEAYAHILAIAECGALKPVVGKAIPLNEAAAAHQLVMASGRQGKIILTMP